MRNSFFLLALASFIGLTGFAQNTSSFKYLRAGMPCPNFKLTDVRYFNKSSVSLGDFRGKWFILDFWNKSCSGCIASFPKVDSFQKKFKDRMQFMLIGYTGSQYTKTHTEEKEIKEKFEKYRDKYNLSLAAAFDSVLFHEFQIYSCPHIIVVDPDGIIRGITYKLTEKNIEEFLAGGQPKLPRSTRKDEFINYADSLPFLVDGNGGDSRDYTFRSVLSPFKDLMRGDNIFRIKNNRLQVLGVGLSHLYQYAYSGFAYPDFYNPLYDKFYAKPIVEIADPAIFNFDRDLRTNLFCYSLEVPGDQAHESAIRRKMQRDLKNYFGYEVSVEYRKMPVWYLEKTAKYPSTLKKGNRNTDTRKYTSVKQLLSDLFNIDFDNASVFLDSTGLADGAGFEIKGPMENLEQAQHTLRENGFSLIRGEREMQVIIIRDDPSEHSLLPATSHYATHAYHHKP